MSRLVLSIAALAGVWAMAAPAALGATGAARINDVVVGPIAATIAIVALAEVSAPLRRLLVPLGAWLCVAPLVLGAAVAGTDRAGASFALPAPLAHVASDVLVGLAWIAAGLVRVHPRHRYGGGWGALVGRPRPGRAS